MRDDVGPDPARVDAVHGDRPVGGDHLLAQGLGEAADAELGRGVGALRRWRHEAEDARQVDEVPVPRCDQCWQEGLRAVDDAEEVDPEDPVEVGEGELLHGSGDDDAGVVHDEVHGAEVVDHLIGVTDDAARSETSTR